MSYTVICNLVYTSLMEEFTMGKDQGWWERRWTASGTGRRGLYRCWKLGTRPPEGLSLHW